MIWPHKPTQVLARQSVDNSVAEMIMHDIFAPKENKTLVWLNKYQLEETVRIYNKAFCIINILCVWNRSSI